MAELNYKGSDCAILDTELENKFALVPFAE